MHFILHLFLSVDSAPQFNLTTNYVDGGELADARSCIFLVACRAVSIRT